MSDNQNSRLTDKDIIPTEEMIFTMIGYNKVFWQRIMNYASENFPGVAGSWNYYMDGKKWLFKLVYKKKTMLWAGILNDTFRVTFWFGDKAEPLIEAAVLPPSVKDEFRTAKKYGSVRPVSVVVREQADADIVLTLLSVKAGIK
jgi:hypothetical protein